MLVIEDVDELARAEEEEFEDCCEETSCRRPPGLTWMLAVVIVKDPVIEAEQAVTVEHESVMVDVDAVLAPEGVKIRYEVLQADVVRAEQELLEVLEDAEEC